MWSRRTHQRIRVVVVVADQGLECIDAGALDRERPHPRDFPNVDLAVRDNVQPSGGQVTSNAGPDAVGGLADVDWDLVEIAQDVNADLVRQILHRVLAEGEVYGHDYTAATGSSARFAASNSSRTCSAMCRTTGTRTPSPHTW
jgi:hypothetical protein